MKYLSEIITLLQWPAVIIAGYLISVYVLKKYEKKQPSSANEQE